jgi:hypothetical protein
MSLDKWSTTPGNNATVGSINWAEGQPPSTVNDSARQMMADVADWYQFPEWIKKDSSITYVSGTTFSISGDRTSDYNLPGRRIRTVVTAGTLYGSISSATYSVPTTTITVAMDSGSLDAGLSDVRLALVDPSTKTQIGVFPAGTRLLFNNAAVPVGWTKESGAAYNDCSVRTVTGSGAATGGATAWSSWNFGGSFNVNTFSLSIGQLASHAHTDVGHAHGVSDPGHSHQPSDLHSFYTDGTAATFQGGTGHSYDLKGTTNVVGTGVSVNAGNANIAATGSGSGITPTYTTPSVKYSDYIIGIKS